MKHETYFTAWNARMDFIETEFIRVAKLFKAQGFTVLTSPKRSGGRVTFIRCRKGKQAVVFCFQEVPYRWIATVDVIPASTSHGSCRGIGENFDPDQFPESWINNIDEMIKPERQDKSHDWLEEVSTEGTINA